MRKARRKTVIKYGLVSEILPQWEIILTLSDAAPFSALHSDHWVPCLLDHYSQHFFGQSQQGRLQLLHCYLIALV